MDLRVEKIERSNLMSLDYLLYRNKKDIDTKSKEKEEYKNESFRDMFQVELDNIRRNNI